MRRVGTLEGRHALDVGDVLEYSAFLHEFRFMGLGTRSIDGWSWLVESRGVISRWYVH